MSKLQFTEQTIDGKLVLNFTGQIDESFPQQLAERQYNQPLIINLDNLKMINSLGIREWIKFINSASSTKVEISHCPKIFIDQVNMVQGFITSNCEIISFYVPYFNEDENLEKNILFKKGVHFGSGNLNVEPVIKTEDNIELELDVVEQKYFKFLKK